MFLKVGYRPDLVDAKPNGGTGGGTAPGALLLLLLLLLAPLRRGGGACGGVELLLPDGAGAPPSQGSRPPTFNLDAAIVVGAGPGAGPYDCTVAHKRRYFKFF
jgi:hypothetical protein